MNHAIGAVLLLCLFSGALPGESRKAEAPLILGKDFYSQLAKTDLVRRDEVLDRMLNRLIQGKGYVESLEIHERYHKRFRIVLLDSEAAGLNIRFFLFTDGDSYQKILKKGDLVEFRGQLAVYTPLSSRRDSYIFDVVLEEGALVVK
jgi:hypothetical protein